MSRVNAESLPPPRLPLARVPIVRTPAGPVVERRSRPRAERADAPVPRVRLALPLDLVEEEIPAKDAFVLSRMNGAAMPLDELIALCPLSPYEVLRILDRWAEKKLVVLA